MADATELVTLAASLDAAPALLPSHASCSPASASSASASSASTIHGGLVRVIQAQRLAKRLVIVSGRGAPTERMYQRT